VPENTPFTSELPSLESTSHVSTPFIHIIIFDGNVVETTGVSIGVALGTVKVHKGDPL
jgi:hypothetical protein